MCQGDFPRFSKKKDQSPHILHLKSLHMLAPERILLTLKHTIKQMQQS
jgi:predicted nucleic acid-binding protein